MTKRGGGRTEEASSEVKGDKKTREGVIRS